MKTHDLERLSELLKEFKESVDTDQRTRYDIWYVRTLVLDLLNERVRDLDRRIDSLHGPGAAAAIDAAFADGSIFGGSGTGGASGGRLDE